MKTGYYIFFGMGDYHQPNILDKKWTYTWELSDWIKFIEDLKKLKIDTLMLYLNGHKLPYPSHKYPNLVDKDHPNIKKEFLPNLLYYIKSQGIKIIAVLTTTGHAGGVAEQNPDAKIEPPSFYKPHEAELISFPQHLRKGKTQKKSGKAQVGFGVLCHNKEKAKNYVFSIIEEIIYLYREYFDGVALHPPEILIPCICDVCSALFLKEAGKNLKEASQARARMFFATSYLKFQKNALFPILSSIKRYAFTIPWLYESIAGEVLNYIPSDVSLIEWDYNLEPFRVNKLKERLECYRSRGHKLIFMPTAGFSFDPRRDIQMQISSVKLQMKLAREVGVEGIIHFLGPKMSDYIVEASVDYGRYNS